MILHVIFLGAGTKRDVGPLLLAAVLVAAGIAYALFLAKSLAGSTALSWISPLSLWQVQVFLCSLLTYPGMPFNVVALIACAVLGLALATSPSSFKLDRRQFGLLILLPSLFLALAIGVSLKRPILLPRIGLWLTIPLCLALAKAVCAHETASRRMISGAACVAVFMLTLASYFVDYRKEDWRAAAHLATTDPRCDGPVLFADVFIALLYFTSLRSRRGRSTPSKRTGQSRTGSSSV